MEMKLLNANIINDDGVKELASAVMYQAVTDYKKALKTNPKSEYRERRICAMERFFKGKMFGFWNQTNMSSEQMMDAIKETAEREKFAEVLEKEKKKLAEKKIYVATLWPNVMEIGNNIESDLAENILPLPCDQRYGIDEMKLLVATLQRVLDQSNNGV